MWGLLINFLGGSVVTKLVDGVLNFYKQKIDAATAKGAQEVDLAKAEILGEIAMRQSAQAIIIAEQGRWYTAIIRPLLAFPVIIYFWKVLVWDTVLHWGTTPALTGLCAEWSGWIIIAYVGGRSIEKVSRIFNTKK